MDRATFSDRASITSWYRTSSSSSSEPSGGGEVIQALAEKCASKAEKRGIGKGNLYCNCIGARRGSGKWKLHWANMGEVCWGTGGNYRAHRRRVGK